MPNINLGLPPAGKSGDTLGLLIAIDVNGRYHDLPRALQAISASMVNRRWALVLTDDASFKQTAEFLSSYSTGADLVDFRQGSLLELTKLAKKHSAQYLNGWFITAKDLMYGVDALLAGPCRASGSMIKSYEMPPVVQAPKAGSGSSPTVTSRASVILDNQGGVTLGSTDVEVFILNYGYLDRAAKTASQLRAAGVRRVEILCADCPKDNYSAYPNEVIIRRPSTDFYSHLWNVAIRRSKAPIFGIITADAELPDAGALVSRMLDFFNSAGERGWIYAPDVDYTVWRYNRAALNQVHRACYEVPNTDSTCWFMRRECALTIGSVDASINTLGYGIDLLGALRCAENDKLCVRDFALEIVHPPSKNYDDTKAQLQERAWAASMELSDKFFELKQRALAMVDWGRPKLSFCTTVMGRKHHLMLTLPSNMKLCRAEDTEFVVLDYGSKDGVAEWISSQCAEELRSGLLKLYRVDWPTRFHISHAKNCAHRLARGELVCSLDADSFLLPEFVEQMRLNLNSGQHNFLRLKSPNPQQHFSLWGRVAMRREHFVRLGGYEELLRGYGFEDSQLIDRAGKLGLTEVSLPYTMGHCIEHYDVTRTENYDDKDMWGTHNRNVEIGLAAAALSHYANQGRAWGCLDDDPYKLG